MILWFVVGLIVWLLCILFMLVVFKGGNILPEPLMKLPFQARYTDIFNSAPKMRITKGSAFSGVQFHKDESVLCNGLGSNTWEEAKTIFQIREKDWKC